MATKNEKLRDNYPAEFNAGVRARAAGLSREDVPHGDNTLQHDAWVAGYDGVTDDYGAAARNATMEGETVKALDQTHTAAKANN